MYLPTEDPNTDADAFLPASISISLYKHASAIGATLARQAVASSSTSAAVATRALTTTSTSSLNGSEAEKWYDRSWIVPVGWALVFYCVLSMVLLCTLYGQGIVDGRLNYISRPSRAPRASATTVRHISSSSWPRDLPDIEDDEMVAYHGRTRGMDRWEEMRVHERREETLRAALVERLLRQRERERQRETMGVSLGVSGEGEEAAREREAVERRETQNLANRLESARVQRALMSLGML